MAWSTIFCYFLLLYIIMSRLVHVDSVAFVVIWVSYYLQFVFLHLFYASYLGTRTEN